MQTNYEKATKLVALGFRVFPCYHEDTWIADRLYERKAPLRGTRGFHDAFADQEDVEAVWGENGNPNLLVAVACGASRIIVLDIDMSAEKGKDGWSSLADAGLDDKIPHTYTYTTGSGGDHYVFRARGPQGDYSNVGNAKDYITDSGLILEDVDRRGNGGYVIWWGEAPDDLTNFAEVPSWFVANNGTGNDLSPYEGLVSDWIDSLPKGKESSWFVKGFLESIPTGDFGHDDMVKLQRNIIGYGADKEPGTYEAIEALRAAWLRGQYNTPENEQDWNVSLAGAISKYGGAISESEKDFWTRRPILEHIHKQSRSSLECSPWALLGAAMLRAVHLTPYYVRYRSNIGSGSLNMSTVFAGGTSLGKSILQRNVKDVLDFGEAVNAIEVGSGEAMSDAFGHMVDVYEENEDGKVRKTDRQEFQWNNANHNCMFSFDEIGKLESMQGRKGSTFLDYIKTGYSGAPFGRVLVHGSGGGTLLAEDTYRFTQFFNAQPKRAGVLFTADEIASGGPSRFLFINVVDPLAESESEDRDPVKMKIKLPKWENPNPYGYGPGGVKDEPDFIEIHATETMRAAHKADKRRGARGEKPDIEGHVMYTRAKIAIALMILEGRQQLNDEDWDLAGQVIAHSDATRNHIRSELAKAHEAEIESQGRQQGKREAAAEYSRDDAKIEYRKNVIKKAMEEQGDDFDYKKLRQATKSTARDLLDEAAKLIGLLPAEV